MKTTPVAKADISTEGPPSGSTRDRRTLIELMSCIILAGFFLAVAYHYVTAMHGGRMLTGVQIATDDGRAPRTYPTIYVGEQYPANTFLFRPWDMFNDFLNIYPIFDDPGLMRSQPFRWNHFPFAFVALLPYYMFLTPALGILVRELLIVLPFLAIAATQLTGDSRFGTLRNVIIFSVCTYPFLFAIDRANNEADIFLLLCWFVFLLRAGRYTRSIVPLGLALSFKPYAGVFLPLLVVEQLSPWSLLSAFRKGELMRCLTMMRKACWGAVAAPGLALALNLISLPILATAFSYSPGVLPQAWKQTVEAYVIGEGGVPFNNSLWAPLKIALFNLDPGNYNDAVRGAMGPYRTVVFLSFVLMCIYAWTCERSLWKRVALCVIAMNVFPYVSADYKLLHLFIPMWLFLNDPDRDPLDTVYATLFALLLVPKNYLRFAAPGGGEANLGVVANPALMVVMLLLIVGSGLRRRAEDGWLPVSPQKQPFTA